MKERVAGWTAIEPIRGGWAVYCKLCGKRFTRNFLASATDYAEAERASRAYALEHSQSEAHRAASEAFHGREQPSPTPEDRILTDALGIGHPKELALRKRLARHAAERVLWQAVIRARQEQSERDRAAHTEHGETAPARPGEGSNGGG